MKPRNSTILVSQDKVFFYRARLFRMWKELWILHFEWGKVDSLNSTTSEYNYTGEYAYSKAKRAYLKKLEQLKRRGYTRQKGLVLPD